jgi:hypothetical protein
MKLRGHGSPNAFGQAIGLPSNVQIANFCSIGVFERRGRFFAPQLQTIIAAWTVQRFFAS